MKKCIFLLEILINTLFQFKINSTTLIILTIPLFLISFLLISHIQFQTVHLLSNNITLNLRPTLQVQFSHLLLFKLTTIINIFKPHNNNNNSVLLSWILTNNNIFQFRNYLRIIIKIGLDMKSNKLRMLMIFLKIH